MHHAIRMLAGALLAAALAACQARPPQAGLAAAEPRPATGTAADDAQATLLQRIDAAIGDAACSDAGQCRTLAIGSRPCGGPASWRAWSAAVSDGAALQAWARQLAELQRQRDAAEGRLSTCQVLPEPGATCRAGRCVLLPGAGAATR